MRQSRVALSCTAYEKFRGARLFWREREERCFRLIQKQCRKKLLPLILLHGILKVKGQIQDPYVRNLRHFLLRPELARQG
jgi:hypothetical protein